MTCPSGAHTVCACVYVRVGVCLCVCVSVCARTRVCVYERASTSVNASTRLPIAVAVHPFSLCPLIYILLSFCSLSFYHSILFLFPFSLFCFFVSSCVWSCTLQAVSEDDGKVLPVLCTSPGWRLHPRHGLPAFTPRSIQPAGGQVTGGKRIDRCVCVREWKKTTTTTTTTKEVL